MPGATISETEWTDFDPGFDQGEVNIRKPNVPGIFGECKVDYGKADVREQNCKGQIGDAQFGELLAKVQIPMSSMQMLWRSGALACMVLLPWSLAWTLTVVARDDAYSVYARSAIVTVMALLAAGPLIGLFRSVLLVKGGELVFARLAEDGRTLILQPGIHLLAAIASEKKRFQVTSDVLMFGTMALVRVRPAFIGLGSDNGTPVFLLPGLHLLQATNLQFEGVKSVNDNLIKNGPLNLVRVQPGLVGLAAINGEPVVLESGVHFINEASFVMSPDGFRKMDEKQTQLGQLQIIVVPRGSIAAVLVNGEGHFLLEGRHYISHGRFTLLSMKSASDEYINAGTRHRILVPRGKLGLGIEEGEPELLEPGKIVLRNSALFKYQGSVDITQPVINHGSLSIVTVRDGQFGISYRDGVIELLKPGRHTLASATHVPGGFIGAGQQTLRISEVTGMSSDNVELRFDAAICMRVVDPQKAVVMLTQGRRDLMDELSANIQERAKLALSIIIGNNSLNRKHGATMQAPVTDGAEVNGPAEKKEDEDSFRQFIHDIFMRSFSESMLKECGVQVIDMSIEDVVIVNTELATAMASAAVANSNLEKATIEAEIVQVTANADAKVALIDAQGKAKAMAVMAKADSERIATISESLGSACLPAQQLEQMRAAAGVLGSGSTVMLAQDTLALATLLGGAQGSKLMPAQAST